MSSTGVRDQNSNDKRIIKGLILNEAQFIQSLRVFANSSTLSGLGSTEGDSNNSPLQASGNYFAKSGDILLGQFGNSFDTIAATNIVNDTLDVSKTSGVTFPVVILQGETPPTADDLVTIIQGEDVFPYQELVIRTRSSIITIKNSDNINTPDGNDLVLPVGSIIHLYFDTFLGEWVIDGGTPFFGGAGVSFPIRPPIDDRGVVTTNQTFILSNSTGHILKLTLGANIDVIFNNFPIIDIQQEWEVEIIQDATTPFVITWPVSVVNPPDPSSYATLGSTTIVVFRTNDAGTTIRVGNTVTTTGGVSTLSGLTIDVNKDWQAQGISNLGALTGVTGIDLDGATALIQGPQKIDFFQASQQIESLSAGIEYSVGDLQSHTFKTLTDEIARFEETAGNIRKLNMLTHRIINAKQFTFDSAASDTIANTEAGFGFDDASNEVTYHAPASNRHVWSINNVDLMFLADTGLTFTDGFRVIFNPNAVVPGINVGQFAGSPSTPINGDLWYDGAGNILFGRINGVNVDLGASASGANTALSNLITTSINEDLIPQTGKTLGDSGNPWSRLTSNKITLGTAGTFSVTDNEIIANAVTGMEFNTPTGNSFSFFFNGGTASFVMDVGQFEGPNFRINSNLFFDDATTFPAAVGQISRNVNALGVKFDEFSVRRDTTIGVDAPEISMTRVDAGPGLDDTIGRLTFKIFDTPTETTYAQIHTTVSNVLNSSALRLDALADGVLLNALVIEGDDNSLRYQILLGGVTPRIQPSVGGMGYFVTPQVEDFSLNIGNSGSLEIPMIDDGSPSVTDLNQAFGAFVGAIGYDEHTAGSNQRIYIRNTDGTWEFFDSAGSI